ncbi:hypothetical protein GYMLUDRAFT_257417 [Collybiopsis luxurians FD-317 M1]|nr:hypothetical protein GYMLUDRAFT_257417 [Collybiopsis luxurians FD-317 M1]
MSSATSSSSVICPSDEQVSAALADFRAKQPGLGRAKILAALRSGNRWSLSEARLKKIMAHSYGSNRTSVSTDPGSSSAGPIEYPKNALAAQQKYKDQSTRCFKIYGRGEYDFGVTPNSHMGTADPLKDASKWCQTFCEFKPLQTIWEFYWAAAQKAGVAKEDIGRQIEEEYGVDPIPFLPPPPSKAEERARKAKFREGSLKLKREMLRNEKTRAHIRVDAHGEPIYSEEIGGQFALIVVKIDKGSGLTEFGEV